MRNYKALTSAFLRLVGIHRPRPSDLWGIPVTQKMSSNCQLLNNLNCKEFIDSFDTVLTDCDGVIYHSDTPIPGVPEVVHKLKSLGKRVFYITNNSTKTRAEFVKKCTSMGYPAVEDDIIGSGFVAAWYLKNNRKYSGKVYCIGHEGLAQELGNVGISSIGVGPHLPSANTLKEFQEFVPDPEIKCVVVGIDSQFNYIKAGIAMLYLRDKDCLFVATNTDPSIPLGNGLNMPGAGSVVAMVQTASGRAPDVICGKPHKPMFDVIMEKYNVDPKRTLMIGDRLETDILFAGCCGLHSLFVLTGSSSLDEVTALETLTSPTVEQTNLIPEFYLPSLADLGPLLDN